MYKTGILTISDKGSRRERKDESGKLLKEILKKASFDVKAYTIVPDEKEIIIKKLKEWVDKLQLDLILTTGGTGLTPRDVTPEATMEVIEKFVPGIAEALRMEGMKKTPFAMLSRAVAGIRRKTLIINLPGSPKAVKEGMEILLSILSHALAKVQGDTTECGRSENG
ncbi:MAG TPA: MogA/MoaB family molybdenum cofactor biosynthesis protein [Candidatus Desulfofervidus auxilii]|uniref:Molybdenum cofactor biosynthesis protein B n=1 Tax=Desulfofervidus auxilii TaxID=1621989 RepID=A0A7V0IAA6_DESA2|nr:MogA/MoaB family molybdenum cofactor biosynthesis protein [Candidatus Desulfofervidus auxilii]